MNTAGLLLLARTWTKFFQSFSSSVEVKKATTPTSPRAPRRRTLRSEPCGRARASGFNASPRTSPPSCSRTSGRTREIASALAAVSKVWRDAEKSDASLPGTPSALCELGQGVYAQRHEHGRRSTGSRSRPITATLRACSGSAVVPFRRLHGGRLHGRKLHEGGALVEKGVRAGARRSDQNGRSVLRGRPRRGARLREGDRVARESGGVGLGIFRVLARVRPPLRPARLDGEQNEALKWYRLAWSSATRTLANHWWEVSRIDAYTYLEAELAAA